MKALLLTTILCFAGLAHADLDKNTATKLIEARQSMITGDGIFAEVLSVEKMADYKGASLYRVNAKMGRGEQTYQVRYPLQSQDGVTDILLTESIYSQPDMAKEFKVTESELAVMTQAASDATAVVVAKDFPEMKRIGIFTFANGERMRAPEAVIMTVQVMYEGMQVPLLRKVYVDRKTLATEVGYDD